MYTMMPGRAMEVAFDFIMRRILFCDNRLEDVQTLTHTQNTSFRAQSSEHNFIQLVFAEDLNPLFSSSSQLEV